MEIESHLDLKLFIMITAAQGFSQVKHVGKGGYFNYLFIAIINCLF